MSCSRSWFLSVKMTDGDWRHEQYRHNKNLPLAISFRNDYNDWSITAIFYSALHLINFYCDKYNISIPTNHRERYNTVRSNLPQIRSEYKNLLALSKDSRYNRPYTKITVIDVQRAQNYLKTIENFILKN